MKLNYRSERVRRKVNKAVFLIELFLWISVVFLLLTNRNPFARLLTFLIAFGSSIALGIILKIGFCSIYNEAETYELSKEFVAKYLSSSKPTQVIPIKAFNPNYTKFVLQLKRTIPFYAIKDEEKVIISIHIPTEIEDIFFEEIDSDFFTQYYRLY